MSLPAWLQRAPPAPRAELLDTSQARRLAEIHAEAFARPWGEDEFERLLAERSVVAHGLLFGRDPAPHGFILSRQVLDEAEVLTVALARDVMGRGYARLLLAEHLVSLARVGVRAVHLEVEEGNAPALALYRRLSFAETGRRPGYYARADGSRACALTMKRRL